MRAISVFSFETGTSTRWCLAAVALRRRVKKSAMGSVCMSILVLLPAGFRDAGNFALERHAAETDAAHLELADIAASAAANAATVAHANFEFRLFECLGDFCCACHLLCYPFFTERKTEAFEKLAALFVVLGGGGEGNVHALDLVDAGVINFRKNQLVFQAQGVISAAVESVGRKSAEIADAGQNDVAQAVEKFVHLVAAERDRAADGHAFADFEVGNGLLGPRDDGLLAGNLAQFDGGGVQQLGVLA